MSWFRWNTVTALMLTIAGAIVPLWNYVLDPFGVFQTHFLTRESYNVNERYRKMEHLLSVHSPDSYILGNSAMDIIDPRIGDRLCPGAKWYNLAVLSGNAGDALRMMRTLTEHGKTIRRFVFGVDVIGFVEDPPHRTGFLRYHPLVDGSSPLRFFTDYLFAPSFLDGEGHIEHALRDYPVIVYDIDNTGMLKLSGDVREIGDNPQDYHRRKFITRKESASNVSFVPARWQELIDLKHWAEANHVTAYWVIPPTHHSIQNGMTAQSWSEFHSRVRNILGIIPDWSTRSAITREDEKMYYDPKHFRAEVGEAMISDVLCHCH